MREADALTDIYGIDIMRDNVELCRLRLGGGTFGVGDTLQPMRRLREQSEEDRRTMLALFGDSTEPQTLFDFADEELAVS